MYLLDTNVWIDYLNTSYPNVVRRIQEASPEELCLSAVVVAELRYGADKSRRREHNHARLDVFSEEIPCAEFDGQTARIFGQVRSSLEHKGSPIGPYDMMIAAHALALDCVLVTANVREFCRIEGLRIENWRV